MGKLEKENQNLKELINKIKKYCNDKKEYCITQKDKEYMNDLGKEQLLGGYIVCDKVLDLIEKVE